MRRIFPTTLTPSYGQHWRWLFATVLFRAALSGPVAPVFAATPVGLWYAEGGAAHPDQTVGEEKYLLLQICPDA